jgi:hypothetical protein
MAIRTFLSSVLGTVVHHVRFPKFYDDAIEQSLLNRQSFVDPEERKKDRKWRLPPAGDKFKDFAFVVVADLSGWEEWAYDPTGERGRPGQPEEERSGSPVQADETKPSDRTDRNPKEQARQYCLKVLPMCVLYTLTHFERLMYSHAIATDGTP